MLTRAPVTVISALGALGVLLCAAAAPAAAATSAQQATPSVPAATGQLLHELDGAWQITKGEGVTIAVLSTPVARVSPLAGKLTSGPDYAPLAGASALDGTVLATVIAGSGPSAADPLGAVGTAPGARILALPIADYGSSRGGKYQNDGTWQNLEAKAIRYAASHGAGVIVPDESGYDDTPALESAVAYAISRNAVVLGGVRAWGSTPNEAQFPNSLPGVIDTSGTTVGGRLGTDGHVALFPDNDSILATAPDNAEIATGPGNLTYTTYGGYTAVAWLAGTVAMMKSVYPRITPAQVARALAVSASDRPRGGYSTKDGFGLIDPLTALHAAASLVNLRSTAAAGPGVVSADARFVRGTPPGIINAIHHSTAKLAAYAGVIVAGLILLILALAFWRRGRRRGTVAAVISPAASTVLPAG